MPDTPGVTVSWENLASGQGGTAISRISTSWFFGYPLYTHDWYDTVDLLPGTNILRVDAYENATSVGEDCITVDYIVDSVAPAVPANLVVAATFSTSVTLAWDASTDNATTQDASVRYRIYRDGVIRASTDTTSYTDAGLANGTLYCYAVSAIDTAGNESLPGSEVCTTTRVP